MRVDVVMRYVGMVMLFIAGFMLLSAGISWLGGMDSSFICTASRGVADGAAGRFPADFRGEKSSSPTREGSAWWWLRGWWPAVGTFPYLIWGGEFSLVNALFESVSGFTTTGATVLTDIEVLPAACSSGASRRRG